MVIRRFLHQVDTFRDLPTHFQDAFANSLPPNYAELARLRWFIAGIKQSEELTSVDQCPKQERIASLFHQIDNINSVYLTLLSYELIVDLMMRFERD